MRSRRRMFWAEIALDHIGTLDRTANNVVERNDEIGLLALEGHRPVTGTVETVDQLDDTDHCSVMIDERKAEHRTAAVAELLIEAGIEFERKVARNVVQVRHEDRLAGGRGVPRYGRSIQRHNKAGGLEGDTVILSVGRLQAPYRHVGGDKGGGDDRNDGQLLA